MLVPSRGSAGQSPIAVVGLGGVFAGAPSAQALWPAILEARDLTAQVPQSRWVLPPRLARRSNSPTRAPPSDRVASTRAGLVRGYETNPDPGAAMAVRAAQEAWADARGHRLDPRRCGVVLANIVLPTGRASAVSDWMLGRPVALDVYRQLAAHAAGGIDRPRASSLRGATPPALDGLAYEVALPAAAIARALGLGPSLLTLDAACASSLFALKIAMHELWQGRLDSVIAGGLSAPDSLYTQMGFTQLGALSATGRCRPFDRAADGLIVGEGASVVILRRLEDALREGDPVRAVITAAGWSNDVDGRLLAPSSEGQLRAMRAAYASAGWAPADVDLIECHATGTPLGDAVELRSMQALAGERSEPIALGAAKANVGHLLTAAGAAALARVLLSLQHETIAPIANFEHDCDALREAAAVRVPTEPAAWHRPNRRPRRAAVSGFGFGGTNAHILLEAFEPSSPSVIVPVDIRPSSADPPPLAIVGVGAHIGPLARSRCRRATFAQRRGRGGPPPPRPTSAGYPMHRWGTSSTGYRSTRVGFGSLRSKCGALCPSRCSRSPSPTKR